MRLSPGKAIINNPATGLESIPLAEFDHAYTGVALVFEPTETFVREGRRPGVLRFVQKRLKGSAGLVAFVLLVSLLTSVLGLVAPLFSRVFLDSLLTGARPEWQLPFVYLFAAFIVMQTVVSAISQNYQLKISGKFAIIAKRLVHVAGASAAHPLLFGPAGGRHRYAAAGQRGHRLYCFSSDSRRWCSIWSCWFSTLW